MYKIPRKKGSRHIWLEPFINIIDCTYEPPLHQWSVYQRSKVKIVNVAIDSRRRTGDEMHMLAVADANGRSGRDADYVKMVEKIGVCAKNMNVTRTSRNDLAGDSGESVIMSVISWLGKLDAAKKLMDMCLGCP